MTLSLTRKGTVTTTGVEVPARDIAKLVRIALADDRRLTLTSLAETTLFLGLRCNYRGRSDMKEFAHAN
jgi:hypothetical protein